MKKKISTLGTVLSKNEQKNINGGDFPFNDCCSCVYVPAGSPFPIFITQSCSDPCPVNGDPEQWGNGC